MIWLIKTLFFGKFCDHEYYVYDDQAIHVHSEFSHDDMPVGQIKQIISRCSKCGKMKRDRFKN